MGNEFLDEDIGSTEQLLKESNRKLKYICENEDVSILIRSIKSVIARDLLNILKIKMDKNWNWWKIDQDDREWMRGELGLKFPSQLSDAFKVLRNAGFVKGKNRIMVNPRYYWKTKTKERPRMIAVYDKYDEKINYETGEIKKK